MKYSLIFLGLLISCGAVSAQATLQRPTFSAGAVDNNQLTATVGEIFATRAVGNSGASLSMGAQPGIETTGVGIQEPLQLAGITVYPNPTNGSVWIKIDALPAGHSTDMRCTVADMQGRIIHTQPAAMGLNHLNIQAQPAGAYLVSIMLPSETKTFRLVKE